MADHSHPRRKFTPFSLSTDSAPPQLPVYSSPPRTGASWSRLELFADNPPDYPESSDEADADESDQEASVHNIKRRQVSPQIYVSPYQSSPRKNRRPPHHHHSPSPSLPSHRPRNYARTSAFPQHAATNSDSYLDSLLARSVHALEISNSLLQTSLSTSSMTTALSTDSPAEQSLEESTTGLSERITKSKDSHKNWIDDLEEIGKRVDSLFGQQAETGDSLRPQNNGRHSRNSVKPPSLDATSPVSQSLPISSGLPQTLAERRRGNNSPLLTVATPISEGQLNYTAHNRSHFVAPPPRALTVYIGSDDTDPDAITLPPTLGHRSPPQPVHPHLFQSSSSPTPSSPVSPRRGSLSAGSNGQNVGTRTSEFPATARAYDILSSYATRQRGSNKITRSQSFGSNTSPIRPVNIKRTQASPTRSESLDMSTSPNTSRGRSLTPIKTIQLGSQLNSPVFYSKPLTPPIEELPSANSSSESETQTNFAVTSLRRIFMDDQALAIERERQLSTSRSRTCNPVSDKQWDSNWFDIVSNSTSASRTRAPPQLLAPPTLPEASTSHATASVSRLLTKNKHSSSTRTSSPPPQSSLRSPSRLSPTLTPGISPSPSILSIPNFFGAGSGGSNNGSGRSTPNRVSFAALPESYANSKPGGPDEQFNREKRRKRKKPLSAQSRSRSLENDSDDGNGWGWWANWLLAASNAESTALRLDQESRMEERVARWGMRPSPM